MLSSSRPARQQRSSRLFGVALAIGFLTFGCADTRSSNLDDTATALAKLPAALRLELQAGRTIEALIELDEAAAVGGDHSGPLGEMIGGLGTDLDSLPATTGEPTRDALVAERAELYKRLQDLVLAAADDKLVEVRNRYENLPLLHVRVQTLSAMIAMAQQPEVRAVHEDRMLEHQLAQSLPLIKQPAAAASGKTGAGTAVAVLDTGCDFSRSDFGSCSAAGATGCKVAYAADFGGDDGSRDDNGHGTNVSAIVLGVAPGTKIIALDVFKGATAPTSAILQAVDWSIQNRATYNIVAMNLSLGGGNSTTQCGTDVFASSLSNARAAGILSAVASGNNGWSNAMASPGCVPAAISVGAVYDAVVPSVSYSSVGCSDSNNMADKITCFSNSTSFLSVLAPGAPITAGGYTMTGTSQATPHVAGAIAVVRAAFASEALDASVARITTTGPSLTDPRNGVTKRRLDLQAAVAGAPITDTTPPTGSVVVNADAAVTRVAAATLTVSGTDASGVAQMCVSNTTACTVFEKFATSKSWSLGTGDGMKTVYVTLKDGAGNKTVVSDTIRLDVTAPTGGTLTAAAGAAKVTLSWSGVSDSGSGVAMYKVMMAATTAPACTAGTEIYNGTATSFVHGGLQNGSVYGYHLCPVDAAGNIGAGATATARPAPEFDAPTGSVVINAGATRTSNPTATLAITASDASGTASMCLSNTTSCTNWIAFVGTKSWGLGTDGVVKVNAWFRDIYGNTSATPVSASITLDTKAPVLSTFTATAGPGQINLSWVAATDASGVGAYKLLRQAGTTAPASCSVGTLVYTGTALAVADTGRTAGTYSYRLCASDSLGTWAAGVTRSATVR